MNIHFEQATHAHKETIFQWLAEPHMLEFWDNSQAHKDDILNFMDGRKTPSHYFEGTFVYWVCYADDQPFAFLLSDLFRLDQPDLSEVHRAHLSKTGHTIGLDFGIGNPFFLGKGLAAPTLSAFVNFYRTHVDSQADTFFIDPNSDNPRAIHVYEKAGFQLVGDFIMQEASFFKGEQSLLMVKKIKK